MPGNHTVKKIIHLIVKDMIALGELGDDKKRDMYLGMGFALGRIFEAETGGDMREAGPLKVLEWAKEYCAGGRLIVQ